jgi:PIN domain nuclease of toxin-antitoxin system
LVYQRRHRLITPARELILDDKNEIYLSMASLWRSLSKSVVGNFKSNELRAFVPRQIEINDFKTLPIESRISLPSLSFSFTTATLSTAPSPRIFNGNLPLISADSAFDAYSVTRAFQS